VTTHPPWVPSRAGRGGPPTHPWLLHYAPEVSDWSGYERGSFFVIPLRLGRLCNWIKFLLCDATIATLRPDNWQCEVHGHRKHASLHMYAWVCASTGKSLCVHVVPRGKTALRAQGRWGLPAGETTHPPPGHTCPTLAKPPTHPGRKINLWGGKSPAAAKEQNPVPYEYPGTHGPLPPRQAKCNQTRGVL